MTKELKQNEYSKLNTKDNSNFNAEFNNFIFKKLDFGKGVFLRVRQCPPRASK